MRVDFAAVAGGPLIGIVMLVYPKQNVDVALFGAEDNATIILVNAYRTEVLAGGITDDFIVDAGRSRVVTEAGNELHHRALFLFGNTGKCNQEVVAESDFGGEITHGFSLARA